MCDVGHDVGSEPEGLPLTLPLPPEPNMDIASIIAKRRAEATPEQQRLMESAVTASLPLT